MGATGGETTVECDSSARRRLREYEGGALAASERLLCGTLGTRSTQS